MTTYTWPTPGADLGVWGGELNTNLIDMASRLTTVEGAVGGSANTYRHATAIVYGSTVPSAIKPAATNATDYVWVCDGTGDEVEINAAISAVATLGAGMVQLVGEFFSISNPILMKTGIYLRGESIVVRTEDSTYVERAKG